VLWAAFYASITLFTPPLLDDADSVHAEVAREMLLRHDYVTLYANGIRYLEKAPLMYWSMAASMRVFQLFGQGSADALAVAARIPLALSVLGLTLLMEAFARRLFRNTRAGLYAALIGLSSFGIFIFTRILLPDGMVCLFTTLALYAFWRTEEMDSQQQIAPSRAVASLPQISLLKSGGAQPLHVVSPEPDSLQPITPVLPASRAQRSGLFAASTRRIHVISSRSPKVLAISTKDRPEPTIGPEPHPPGQVIELPRPSEAQKIDIAAPPETVNDAVRPSWLSWRKSKQAVAERSTETRLRLYCGLFAGACALNVLSKGLIGVVFPVAIVVLHLLLTRGSRRAWRRMAQLHPWATLEACLFVAVPWHVLAAFANPTEGHPAPFRFVHLHWIVPMPSDGNVRGWTWFYFMNEHLLRYLNLRVPHDYDTSPMWLFWGLCFIWLMPWSAYVFKATGWVAPFFGSTRRIAIFRSQWRRHDLPLKRRGALLLLVWAAFVLLFFAFSTRQEYYVLPALPALGILIAAWLAQDSFGLPTTAGPAAHPATRITGGLVVFGTLFATAVGIFLLRTPAPVQHADLSGLLSQNPADYALSMGHFLDLDAQALILFRVPLALAALSLWLGPLAAFLLRMRRLPHAANLAMAAGAFGFLLAAFLGLRTFSPVLTSAQLARAIATQVRPQDLVAIHGEYESGSTLGFYLQRPATYAPTPGATNFVHILDGRSSNLWYGSFFRDAPAIFETSASLAQKWASPQRVFLWQSLTDPPDTLPLLPGPVYVLARSGGKEIVSNQPNH
jgi:4-amino-4-deoxy-L-arabinose transferase-like glycosyltransferase